MGRIFGYFLLIIISFGFRAQAQVDTAYVFNSNTAYGVLDLRLALSSTNYYYLQEDKTFSFRESAPGVKTNTFFDMTEWDSSPYKEGNLREKNGTTDQFVMNYRLLPPQNYNVSYAQGYPLLLIMHGLGESGNCSEHECHHADKGYSPRSNTPAAPVNVDHPLLNNDHHLTQGGIAHLRARNEAGTKLPDDATMPARAFPGFVLFPQNMNGWDGKSTQDAIRIVRLLCKKYNIDENRIYIHGLSNGGHGVFEALKRAPWMFAAALTMSAIDDAFINQQQLAPTVAHIPLWMFQGGMDKNPYPQKTENYVKKFRDAGADVRYTKYPNLGHGTWATAYKESDFFSWMLGKSNANIHTFSGGTSICGPGLKLELPDGYLAYQWQLNGQTIAGANTSSYTATSAGTYRARFSRVANPTTEAQWNRWSNPVVITGGQAPPQAQIQQHGTVILPDLNNYANARLEAVGNFGHYYWYKDGVLVDFPGDQDDTIKYATITPAMGKGAYTLVTSNFDNCLSPVSAAKHLFFSNQAPVNITAPTNFAGTVNPTTSEVTLTWSDVSNNESGFEIWRRRKLDETNFSTWEMAVLTNSNVTSFKETGLLPTSNYEYKIRAVSNTGVSNYSPGTGSLQVTTTVDKQPPSVPQNLTVAPTGVQRIKLAWRKSTDNTGVKEYYVYYGSDSVKTNGADTTLVLKDLALNKMFKFKVKAIDVAGNRSAASEEKQGSTFVSGLYYEHNTGIWFDLDSIDWSTPEFTGMVQTFTLAPKTQEEYFNFRFDGFLLISTEGSYQFRTGSSDASRLKLNNVIAVDNDGVHDFKIVEGANQTLTKNAHRITVEFFEYNEQDSLLVQYKGPDTNNEWATIPATALKSDASLITAIGADDGPEDSFIVSIYPNPSTQENINLKLQTIINKGVHVELLDPIGKRLSAEDFEPDQLKDGVRISAPGILSAGIYFVTVSQGNITVRQRVIIKN